jgi:membrane protein
LDPNAAEGGRVGQVEMSLVERLDRFQRAHPRAGVPIAVVYKFFDDQGNYLAALIAYYGFLSLFPLLLLLSTILNFVLAGNADLQHQVFNSALGQFPVVGRSLTSEKGVSGSGVGLAIGVLGTIYGGLGVAQASQNAMNNIWRVPRNSRPNPLMARLRSLALLSVFAVSVAGTTVLSALSASANAFGASVGLGLKALFVLLSLAVNSAVFLLGFLVATTHDHGWRQVVRGAVAAAIGWQILQFFGTSYVGHVVKNASETNGVFALVLGLIAWIYLEALIVVMAAEYNAVRALGLYPRALLTPFTDDVDLTSADQKSYAQQARAERTKGYEEISVTFDPPGDDPEQAGQHGKQEAGDPDRT